MPNESALVTDSEDESDANETLHDAETISDKAHAPMPLSQLSPRRTRESGPISSLNANVNPARPPHEPVRATQRLRSPPHWPPAWVVVIGLQLISARSEQPRR